MCCLRRVSHFKGERHSPGEGRSCAGGRAMATIINPPFGDARSKSLSLCISVSLSVSLSLARVPRACDSLGAASEVQRRGLWLSNKTNGGTDEWHSVAVLWVRQVTCGCWSVTSTYTAGERFSSGSVRAVLARRPGRHLMVKRSTRARFTGRPPSASVRLIPTFTPPAGHTAHDARRSSRVSVISRAGGKASQKKTIHIVQTGETALDDRREGG